jgi:hypothetical protein
MKTHELPKTLALLEASLKDDFSLIKRATSSIKTKLQKFADGKDLKGDEITGWLGEVYGKLYFGGKLVPDNHDYDLLAQNMRISIKARKGYNKGWNISSTIPRIDGDDCPTHLAFVHFTDSYSLDRIWIFSWKELKEKQRFLKKKVHGLNRGYYIKIDSIRDEDNLSFRFIQ